MNDHISDIHDEITIAFKNALAEEYATGFSELYTLSEVIAALRDTFYINVFNQANMVDFWELIRESRVDKNVGLLTYRFFNHLVLKYDIGVYETLANIQSVTLSKIYGFEGINDVNKTRLPTMDSINKFLLGNPWMSFLLVAENHLSIILDILESNREGKTT